MADEVIMQQVDIMDETASKTVTTKEDKQQLTNVKTKKPEEDKLDIWEMCVCESVDCSSCQADKEAIISATVWLDSQTDTQTSTQPNSQSHIEESVADETTKLEDKTERDPNERFFGTNFYDEMQRVSILVPSIDMKAIHEKPPLSILLHPSLCATQFHKFRGNSFACGIITLQFAHKVIKAKPAGIFHMLYGASCLGDEVYEIVSSSLRDGNDMYMANYKGRSECLSSEIIILINNHLDIQLIEEVTQDRVMNDTLVADIMSLEREQILLFTRMKDYKVWTAVRYKEDSILIFDCQSQNCILRNGELAVCGGIIYLLHRKPELVKYILNIAEVYGGPFTGQCKIATIQT